MIVGHLLVDVSLHVAHVASVEASRGGLDSSGFHALYFCVPVFITELLADPAVDAVGLIFSLFLWAYFPEIINSVCSDDIAKFTHFLFAVTPFMERCWRTEIISSTPKPGLDSFIFLLAISAVH